MWAFGADDCGQLGLAGGEAGADAEEPGEQGEQGSLPREVQPLAGVGVVSIAAGGAHSSAVSLDGALWLFGSGEDGQLGLGDDLDQNVPQRLAAPQVS